DGPPGNYEVYVNYPEATYETAGSHPHYVGVLGGFGADHRHGGHAHGIRADFDITDLVRYLDRSGGWDPALVTVTFVPTARQEDGYTNVATRLRVGHMSVRTLSSSE
ncbi:MAG TPA: hypothetical protein VOB72_02035, partial [Candidatus Dormibacteraeota bacterium]|nr:hypothetical protein [Candidatus Dormibacteraeota bacterium]